ncbi:MAG: hypothetical protein HQM00_11750 [Magnetococcales bacterium]|nr:hypothetical protein [Magnetococcales bacterium]
MTAQNARRLIARISPPNEADGLIATFDAMVATGEQVDSALIKVIEVVLNGWPEEYQ